MPRWTKEEIEILKKEYPKIEDLSVLVRKINHSKRAVINKAYSLKIKRDKGLWRKKQGKSIKEMWKDPNSIYNSKGYRNKLKLVIKKRREKLGYVNSPSKRKAISEGKKGHIVTDKTKQKLREFYLGKTYEEIHGVKKAKEIKKKLRRLKKGKSYEELYGDKADNEKEKRRNTHKNLWKDEEYAKKRFKIWRIRPTHPEKVMIELIEKNNLSEIKYTGDGKFWIKGFNPDFVFKGHKKIIEVFGDYWHNLPKNIKRDQERLKTYSIYGYKTLIIWEHELVNKKEYGRKLSKKEIINKIKKFHPSDI